MRLTKVVAIVVPALVASSLLLVQSLLSIFIIFLPEVFVLQDLVGSIHLDELVMGRRVALQHSVWSQRSGSSGVLTSSRFKCGMISDCGFCRFCVVSTHRVFVRVHGERQLLEGLSDLSGRGLPVHPQQSVVVLTLGPDHHQQGDQDQHEQRDPDEMGRDNPAPHYQSSQCNHSNQLQPEQLKHTDTRFFTTKQKTTKETSEHDQQLGLQPCHGSEQRSGFRRNHCLCVDPTFPLLIINIYNYTV